MNRFLECFPIVLKAEGGYVNHPNDYGQATNKGVTQEVYDDFRASTSDYIQDVRHISPEEVQSIYSTYWAKAKCDKLPKPLDLVVFDVSINSGPNKAIVLLQRALGMSPQHHTGNFGPITTRALQTVLGVDGLKTLCDRYLQERIKFYNNRARLDPTQSVFLSGWLKRVENISKEMWR